MFRGSAHDGKGRRTLLLGLEPGNFERLQKGQPIQFSADELGVACDVIIFAGANAEAMARQLGCAIIDTTPKGRS